MGSSLDTSTAGAPASLAGHAPARARVRILLTVLALVAVTLGSLWHVNRRAPAPSPRWSFAHAPLPADVDNGCEMLAAAKDPPKLPSGTHALVMPETWRDQAAIAAILSEHETALAAELARTHALRRQIADAPRFVDRYDIATHDYSGCHPTQLWPVRSVAAYELQRAGDEAAAASELASMWRQAVDFALSCASMQSCYDAVTLLQETLATAELLVTRPDDSSPYAVIRTALRDADPSAFSHRHAMINEYRDLHDRLDSHSERYFNPAATEDLLADAAEDVIAWEAAGAPKPVPPPKSTSAPAWWLVNVDGKRWVASIHDSWTVHVYLRQRELEAIMARRDRLAASLASPP